MAIRQVAASALMSMIPLSQMTLEISDLAEAARGNGAEADYNEVGTVIIIASMLECPLHHLEYRGQVQLRFMLEYLMQASP